MYTKILLAIDLAQASSWEKALPSASRIARTDGAELHVCTVIPPMGMSIVGTYLPPDAEQRALSDAKAQLKTFLEHHGPDGITVKGHVLKGTIYQEIIRAADTLQCDLIVMASHRPELQDYLLGPNAARVVRHAKQSVHVVRS